MGGLQSYSGLTTKIREMQEQLLKKSDYAALRAQPTVRAAVNYLMKWKCYQAVLRDIPEEKLHRGVIEEHLIRSGYEDFTRVYLFASQEQRKYLHLYFTKFEAEYLRKCLRRSVAVHPEHFVLDEANISFFRKYSHLKLDDLMEARGLQEFTEATRGSRYYSVLHMLQNKNDENPAEYEAAIDMRHYRMIWESGTQLFSGRDLAVFRETEGTRIDFLNFELIYRAKRFYGMTPEEIYALIIPVRYKFRKNDIVRFVTAQDPEMMFGYLKRSEYGPKFHFLNDTNFKNSVQEANDHLYHEAFKHNPYTIACMVTYFYEKERELERIIHALEVIRYTEKRTPEQKGGSSE